LEKEVSYCQKITKAEAEINWKKESAKQIYNKMRAFDPWPGIFFFWQNRRIKIISGRIINEKEAAEASAIQTKSGYFLPIKIIPEGKKEMLFSEWIRGKDFL
jgi:methionyl-tRNA formyltransferase